MELIRKPLSLLVTACVAATLLAAGAPKDEKQITATAQAVKQYVNGPAMTAIRHHGEAIASFGSRQTGQPGCTKTAEYIRDQFTSIGLEGVALKTGQVTVPASGDGSVTLPDGRTITAFPLVPNGVQPSSTPAEGLSGRLIYAGEGRIEGLQGKDLDGAILLMDYNSGNNWQMLMGCGAAAAIFIEPEFTTWAQTDGKYIDLVPLRFPRVWVSAKDGQALAEAAKAEPQVTLRSKMSLDNVDAPYVEGFLTGTAKSDATINMVTSFDSRSIAPTLTPGGDEVWGAAAIIELARFLKGNRPPMNVRFVAFSGNWQNEALSRLYVAQTFSRIGTQDRITCGIDLSTDSDGLSIDWNGIVGSSEAPQFTDVKRFFFGVEGTNDSGLVGEIESFYGSNHRFYGGTIPMPHESEFTLSDVVHKRPLIIAPRFYTPNESWEQARATAIVFQTDKVWRYLHNTPLETFDKSVKAFDNLKPQVTMLFYSVSRLAQYAVDETNLPIIKPVVWSTTQSTSKGFAEVRGNVRVFSLKTAWYDKELPRDEKGDLLGDTYVYAYPYNYDYPKEKILTYLPWPLWPQRHWHQGMQSFMNRYIVKVGADGSYYIPGIAASHQLARFNFLAYTLDRNGNIIFATDFGLRGDMEFPITDMSFFTDKMQVPITVFPCGSLALFSLDNLEKFNYGEPVPDEWMVNVDYMENEIAQQPYLRVGKIMRAGARTEADEYSFVQWKNIAMVFLKPDTPSEILLNAAGSMKRYVLNDSRQPTDQPPGYSVAPGETKSILFTPLAMLQQISFLNTFRLGAYNKYGVKSYEAEKEHKLGSAYLDIAKTAYAAKDYSTAVSSAELGVASEGQAYRATLGLLWDVVSTTVFYFTLLIPFSFLTERLLFPQSTPSRTLLVSSAIFVIFVGLLWIFHPGFKLADNIWITIISFLIVILTLPAVFLIVSRGLAMIKESGQKYYRSHGSDVERLGVLVAALSLAISNMRRRKLRTGLTLTTITLLILALVLLTTSTSFNYTYNQPRAYVKTETEGILVSNTYSRWRGIFKDVYELLDQLYSSEAVIVPREYHNYAYSDTMASKRKIFLTNGSWSVELPAIQILDEKEPAVTHIDKALVAGRWFTADDVFAVIISKKMAVNLKTNVNGEVTFERLPLKVVGIFDGGKLDKEVLDPDGAQVTPLYFADPSQGDMQHPAHFPSEDICYLPRGFNERTKLLHTAIWSVVIKPLDKARIKPIADSIALEIPNVDVFKSIDGQVSVLSAYHKVSIKGSAFMIMPLAVAFFMVLAVMLGTVHERKREINIFSSVGLSPRHVAGMFFVESIVYAGIASVFGYFIGIILLYIFRIAGLFPPVFYPNYLGIFVIYSVGLAMLATVSSSAYPMYVASRIANPSLERTWRIGTKPENGRWLIEFPFIASDAYEVLGIMAFLKEFVEHFSGEGMGVFASLTPSRLTLDDENHVTLEFAAWLAPFERNVTQVVRLRGTKDAEKNRWNFAFDIQYLSGPTYLWLKSNKLFVDAFRKQMLIWRAFSDAAVEEYIWKGNDAVHPANAPARPNRTVAVGGTL